MKNWKYTLLYLWLLALPLGMVSCADDPDEIPSGEIEKPEDSSPSYYDPWIFGDYMDVTVHPGDNFFNYCNGTWLSQKGHYDGDGFINDVQEVAYRQLISLDIPMVHTLTEHAEQIGQTTEQAQARMDADLNYMEEEIGWTESPEQMVRAIVELAKRGYTNIAFSFWLLPEAGTLKLMVAIDSEEGDEEESLKALQSMGYSAEQADKIFRESRRIKEQYFPRTGRKYTPYNMSKHPEWRESIRSAAQMTRSAGSDLLNVMIQELGFTPDQVLYEDAVIQMLNAFYEVSLDEMKSVIVESISEAFAYAINAKSFKNQLNDSVMSSFSSCSTYEKMIIMMGESILIYPISKLYVENFVTDSEKQRAEACCEEIRRSFDKRIDRADWISEPTRALAKEKLAAMEIEVFYPEQWLDTMNPTIEGPTFLDDVLGINKTTLEGSLSLVGKPAKGNMINVALLEDLPLFVFNAFYAPEYNAVAILPVVMSETMFSPEKPDAYNYASMSIIGHEITHGFDAEGSLYDAQGAKNEWWTAADRAEFETRQQKLVVSYSALEVVPGHFNNGQQTLNENIADLGGILIARDALMEKLNQAGYTEEQLQQEERRFFQAYANLWRTYYSKRVLIYGFAEDEHSADKERVNGVVRNIESWYNLYEVTDTHNLYLTPEERASIW